MRINVVSAVVGASLLLNAPKLAAHHSFAAEFDVHRPVKFRGIVTKMEWINPHAWIHVDVKGPDGKSVSWMVEAGTRIPYSGEDLPRTRWLRERRFSSKVIKPRTDRTRRTAAT